jgi:hypothetical protein
MKVCRLAFFTVLNTIALSSAFAQSKVECIAMGNWGERLVLTQNSDTVVLFGVLHRSEGRKNIEFEEVKVNKLVSRNGSFGDSNTDWHVKQNFNIYASWYGVELNFSNVSTIYNYTLKSGDSVIQYLRIFGRNGKLLIAGYGFEKTAGKDFYRRCQI